MVNGEPGRARVPAAQRRCGDCGARAATTATGGGTFVLDVHLGTLARRLRLVGVDAAYANDADDDALIEQANADRRMLLTQDPCLLRRRGLWLGAYVRGAP